MVTIAGKIHSNPQIHVAMLMRLATIREKASLPEPPISTTVFLALKVKSLWQKRFHEIYKFISPIWECHFNPWQIRGKIFSLSCVEGP